MSRISTFTPRMGASIALVLSVSGCLAPSAPGGFGGDGNGLDLGDEVIITDFTMGPPDARPGACYGKDATPAVIEQVTERVLVEAPQIGADGNVIAPARYEEKVSSRIVEGREPVYFETPCPPRWTPEFIASVQRALTARGFYAGYASGELDQMTRNAIRSYQLTQGLNSAILSVDSARALGLVEVDLAD